MKLVSKSLNSLSIEPFARKNGKEQQKLTFTKIHSDVVYLLASLFKSFSRLLNKLWCMLQLQKGLWIMHTRQVLKKPIQPWGFKQQHNKGIVSPYLLWTKIWALLTTFDHFSRTISNVSQFLLILFTVLTQVSQVKEFPIRPSDGN